MPHIAHGTVRAFAVVGLMLGLALPPIVPVAANPAAQQQAAPIYSPNGHTGTVYRLYRAYFLREPDRSGYDYWLGRYNAGMSLTLISDEFTRSAEFQSDYGDVHGGDFVRLVYTNVLERTPDQAGYDYWVGQMSAGMPRGVVMINFSDSNEFRSKTSDGVPPGYRTLVVKVSGNDDRTFELGFDRLTIVHATHDGDGHFAIEGLDANGDFADLGPNEIGTYEGTTLLDNATKIRFIEVSADGPWTATFMPLSDAPSMSLSSASGRKDHVAAVQAPQARLVRLTHDGSSNFAVIARRADGSYGRLLVNEIGAFDGEVVVPKDTGYLEVKADGRWTVRG